jgi:hypothetical protein
MCGRCLVAAILERATQAVAHHGCETQFPFLWFHIWGNAAQEALGHHHRFLSEVGLVRAEDQRLELFGTDTRTTPLQGSSRAETPLIVVPSQEQDIKKKE